MELVLAFLLEFYTEILLGHLTERLCFFSPQKLCVHVHATHLTWNSKVQEGNLTDIPLGKANMFYDSCQLC